MPGTFYESRNLFRVNIGAGVAQETMILESGASPAARIEGVGKHLDGALDLRARPHNAPRASYSWDHYCEYNGRTEQWDLIIEWRTDPGRNLELNYIVDQPAVHVGKL